MTASILDEVIATLVDRATTASTPLVTVGDSVVMVELIHPDHDRLAGLAHRPDEDLADVGVNVEAASVSTLAGFATSGETYLGRAIGVATLNALSAPDVDWRVGDPMAALSTDVGAIATVGLFRPAFRKFDAVDVRVVERDPTASVDAPAGVTVELFSPDRCEEAFEGVDLCFITGSVLIYGGIDRYLAALSEQGVEPVVLVGHTASHLPEPAFEAGVDVVAGARVDDPEHVREHVIAGECATDLHDHGLEKVYVTRGERIRGLTLA